MHISHNALSNPSTSTPINPIPGNGLRDGGPIPVANP